MIFLLSMFVYVGNTNPIIEFISLMIGVYSCYFAIEQFDKRQS